MSPASAAAMLRLALCSLAFAASAGCAAAALSTTGYGATDPLPHREQIRAALGIEDSLW